jgi:hypothetical protein
MPVEEPAQRTCGKAMNRSPVVLKRQMYGRAKLDLMRIRVLHPN